MGNDNLTARVSDVFGGIFANDVSPAFDATNEAVRVYKLECAFLVVIFVDCGSDQPDAEQVCREGAHSINASAAANIAEFSPCKEVADIAAVLRDIIGNFANSRDFAALN